MSRDSAERTQRGRKLARSLVIFNANVLGVTVGLLSAFGLVIATVVLLLQGNDNPGPMLGQLAFFLPGYSVSLGGALVGAIFAGLFGYIGGAILGLLYGRWMLRAPTRSLQPDGTVSDLPSQEAPIVLLNPLPLAIVCGALAAVGLVVATDWLSLRYAVQSQYLALLVHYLPGYRPTVAGSLVGAAWMFGYGFAAAGSVAVIYNRLVALRIGARPSVPAATPLAPNTSR